MRYRTDLYDLKTEIKREIGLKPILKEGSKVEKDLPKITGYKFGWYMPSERNDITKPSGCMVYMV